MQFQGLVKLFLSDLMAVLVSHFAYMPYWLTWSALTDINNIYIILTCILFTHVYYSCEHLSLFTWVFCKPVLHVEYLSYSVLCCIVIGLVYIGRLTLNIYKGCELTLFILEVWFFLG